MIGCRRVYIVDSECNKYCCSIRNVVVKDDGADDNNNNNDDDDDGSMVFRFPHSSNQNEA